MKRKLYIWAAAAALISLTSCSDILDKHSAAYDSDGFYKTDRGLEEGVNGVYRLVPFELNYLTPMVLVQDGYSAFALEYQENNTIGAGGGLTPDQGYVNSYWAAHWRIIARAHTVIDGAKTDQDDMTPSYRQHLAEAKVIRAYAYYNLVTTYGDIPFFTAQVQPDQYHASRTDKKTIVDWIINDLQEIIDSEVLAWTAEQRGRVDRATAAAILSRFALFAGSMNLGGEGQSYFQKAADAAKLVMEHRKLATNYADLFTLDGQKKADVRDEMLWELEYIYEGTLNTRHIHWGRYGIASRSVGGSSVRFPSLLLVDTYECTDGLRIDASPLYDPKKPSRNRDLRFRQTLVGHGDTLSYSSNGGVKVNKYVLNAYDEEAASFPDPRRPGRWTTTDNLDRQSTNATFCNNGAGWLWNKYNEDLTQSSAESSCDISIIRSAECYLTYAEAMIEMGKYDDPSVLTAINAVRGRARQPLLNTNACVEGETLDGMSVQDKFRQRVRRERKCELAMEGVIFTDMRRWQIGDICNEFPTYCNPKADIRYEGLDATDVPNYSYGLDPERSNLNDIAHYEHYKDKLRVRDRNRYWKPAFQWWPIPRVDTDRDPNLSNPDYE